MIEVDFSKSVRCPWTVSDVDDVFRVIGRKTGERGRVEVNIVGDAVIRRLNRHYRGQDKVTDVLAFAWGEDPVVPSDYRGQIYLCYPEIVRQAKAFGATPQEEFVRMLAHGFLHILGYDHDVPARAKKMFALQEDIVETYCIRAYEQN